MNSPYRTPSPAFDQEEATIVRTATYRVGNLLLRWGTGKRYLEVGVYVEDHKVEIWTTVHADHFAEFLENAQTAVEEANE